MGSIKGCGGIMQELEYRDGRRIQEFFQEADDAGVWDKMRARFADLEKDGDIVRATRTQLTKNQAKRLRRKETQNA
jgi:hypothetical protein